MLKVKMVSRHTAVTGKKLERGLEYFFPPSYAEELIKHGLAVLAMEEKKSEPEKPKSMIRTTSGRFAKKGKAKL